MMIENQYKEYKNILQKICKKDTCQSREGWSGDNPFKGHCTVVSLLTQDIFGGEILWSSLNGTGFIGNHYWNLLPNGQEVDFTSDQFGDNCPKLIGEVRKREFLLSSQDTEMKYNRLAMLYNKEISTSFK